MSSNDAASYGRAVELIRPTGDPLELVAARYAEAVKLIGNGSRIIVAAKLLAEREKCSHLTVTEVMNLMLKAKEGKREERTLTELRVRLTKFANDFKCPIASVTKAEVQAWLDRLKNSERDRLNFRTKLNTLFRWAWKRGYILENPVEKTERPDPEDADIQIYTPAEIQRLINAASKDFLPCLAIGAFAGLRSSEVMRLKWEDINLARGFITASAKKRGTPSRRLVPIQPNLAAWLSDYANSTGYVWPGTDEQFTNAQQDTSAATRIETDVEKQIAAQEPLKWKHNGLRHSYISYRLAMLQDDAKTALEAGNSSSTIHAHYKELVTPDDAKLWFSIAPETPANVVAINGQP
jgi:integrase